MKSVRFQMNRTTFLFPLPLMAGSGTSSYHTTQHRQANTPQHNTTMTTKQTRNHKYRESIINKINKYVIIVSKLVCIVFERVQANERANDEQESKTSSGTRRDEDREKEKEKSDCDCSKTSNQLDPTQLSSLTQRMERRNCVCVFVALEKEKKKERKKKSL